MLPGGGGLIAVRVPSGGTITKAPTTTKSRWAVIGDSEVQGSGTPNVYPDRGAQQLETFAPRLLKMIGADEYILAGIGGTGWTTANAFSSRVAKVISFNPNGIIFFGSVNDGAANAGLYQNVKDTLALCVSVARVVVVTVPRSGFSSNTASVRQATLESGRHVIDLTNLIKGTGKITAPTGDGNADYFVISDGIHKTLNGHKMVARECFNQYAKLFLS